MRSVFVFVSALVVSAAVATASLGAGASHRLGHITGSLSRSGYTVLAIAYNGEAISGKGPHFSIAPPASLVTLQLVNAQGKYAGPVVVSGGGKRVYMGVRAGAKLGTIKVMNGYAVVARPLASRFVDKSRWAHALHGVPVANGRNFGLVRISGKHTGSSALGGDLAHSGVPNDINIDPQANMQIAALAPKSKPKKAKAAARGGGGPACDPSICFNGGTFYMFSSMGGGVLDVANVDAGSTMANIDDEVGHDLKVFIGSPFDYNVGNIAAAFPPGTSLAELDCTGLSWCSPLGSGHLAPTDDPDAPGPAFPDCCDPSGDGFGTIFGPGAPTFTQTLLKLWPDAPSEQIGTGDTPILNLTVNGTVVQQPLPLAFVFDTVPAIDTWSDGAGDSGTLTYPGSGGGQDCAGASPGTDCNPLPVAAGPSGDALLTVTWWRPQREGIPGAGEPAWMDIGHLAYSLNFISTFGGVPTSCPGASITTNDPDLVNTQAPLSTSGANNALIDTADDQPANPANTLTATVDLTQCFADAGQTFSVGSTTSFMISASPQQSANIGNTATIVEIEGVG